MGDLVYQRKGGTKRKAPAGFGDGTMPEPKLNTFQKTELSKKVIQYILNGEPRSVCLEVIEQNSPVQLSKTGMQNIYEYSQKCIEELVEMDAATIIPVHIMLYEKIYTYFNSIGNVDGANKAMFHKEKLLGLHKTENKVVHNKKTTVVVNNNVAYNMNALSGNQKVRFQLLIDKAKK